jgi:hypothetical protein
VPPHQKYPLHGKVFPRIYKYNFNYLLYIINSRLTKRLKFKKTWLTQSGFLELLVKWWLEYHIIDDYRNA